MQGRLDERVGSLEAVTTAAVIGAALALVVLLVARRSLAGVGDAIAGPEVAAPRRRHERLHRPRDHDRRARGSASSRRPPSSSPRSSGSPRSSTATAGSASSRSRSRGRACSGSRCSSSARRSRCAGERRRLAELEPALLWERFSELTRIARPSKEEGPGARARPRVGVGARLDAQVGRGGQRRRASFRRRAGRERRPIVVLQAHLDMVCERDPESPFDPREGRIDVSRRGRLGRRRRNDARRRQRHRRRGGAGGRRRPTSSTGRSSSSSRSPRSRASTARRRSTRRSSRVAVSSTSTGRATRR